MRALKVLVSALAIVLVTVMATDYVAMAATGKPLILGKLNKASKTTTIKSANGPALALKTRPGHPPLSVNRSTKVPNFNADFVDGKDSTRLGVRTRVETFDLSGINTNQVEAAIETPPPGTYLIDYSLWLYTDAGTSGYCRLLISGENRAPETVAETFGGVFLASSSTIATLSASDELLIRCDLSMRTNVIVADLGLLTFTAVDVLTGDPIP